MKKTLFFGLMAAVAMIGSASASIITSDDFTYTDGALVPNGAWVSHSGNAGDLLVAGGQAVVQHGTPSEDAHLVFAEQSTGVLRAEFDIVVNDDTVIGASGTDFEYFAHFMSDGLFNFRSRLDVQAPSAIGGDYTLGISSSTSTAQDTLATDFNFGETVSVILDFDLETGTGSLTVGGETVTGLANGAEALDSFALRQSDSSNNESITVDNLVISNISAIPEPGSLTILALLAATGVLRRRR